MAIQLNERDHLIFKMIDEHKVLLEKHISWFISQEEKPVLIRDRLRKLFYLDYLLCQRHNTKLPWWTTPTKPLVYMLSPISRGMAGTAEDGLDLFNSDVQRHLLEVANIRMLGLIAQKDGEIKEFTWTTCHQNEKPLDGIVSLVSIAENNSRKIGIINHPDNTEKLLSDLANLLMRQALVQSVLLVSRDDKHLKELQAAISKNSNKIDPSKVMFVTHQDLYQTGLSKACLLDIKAEKDVAPVSPVSYEQSTSWNDLGQARAS